MRDLTQTILYWAPRALGLLFAAFLSVFALDVFDEGQPLGPMLVALAMHLVPAGVVLVALAVSWRWGWAGGLAFLALGAWYLVSSWGRFPWLTYLAIAGPLFLLGILFEIDWWYGRRRARSGTESGL